MMRTKFIRLLLCVFCTLSTFNSYAIDQVKVSCVGNSITYGTGISDREQYAYPVQLQKLLGENYIVGNFGKPGATLLKKGHRPYVEQEEYKKALSFAGDIVVIHLGINDTDPRNWPNYKEEFVSDYLDLINDFREVNPKCRVLLAEMTPIAHRHPRFLSGTRDWHAQIQAAIRTVADVSGAQLIDFFNPLYPYPHLLPDAIHPNAEGAALLAKIVYSSITGDFGGLSLPAVFADGMILPHNKTFEIAGKANAEAHIKLSLNKRKYLTKADASGNWKVIVDELPTGGPYTMNISSGKDKIEIKDILAGEIWLCSGQSNMEFELRQADTAQEDIAKANNSNIRLYNMQAKWRTNAEEWSIDALKRINHLDYLKQGKWEKVEPSTVSDFSAIGYYFGQMLQDSLQVPIGLVCNAVGGAPTESWISRSTLEYEFPAILNNWTQNDFIQPWVRGRALQNIAKRENALQRHPYEPAYLFEAGIQPLVSLPLSGIIWYQGESNAHNLEAFSALFELLVRDWRKAWKNADMPWLFVQLSSLNRPSWPSIRNEQRLLSDKLDNVYMAVSSDCGNPNDVHPTQKKPIGERLALQALNHVYGKKIVSSGPILEKAELLDNKLILTFDSSKSLKGLYDEAIRGFEIAEFDGLYFPVNSVRVNGNKIIIESDSVTKINFVRYGWKPFTDANLVNEADLPASTFKISL